MSIIGENGAATTTATSIVHFFVVCAREQTKAYN